MSLQRKVSPGLASQYRHHADEQRGAAAAAELSNVREKHLAAADKWEIMADEAERFEPEWLNETPQSRALREMLKRARR